MNAVSFNAPAAVPPAIPPTGLRGGTDPLQSDPSQASTPGAGGFVDLISLLLGGISPESQFTGASNVATEDADPSAAAQTATPDQIAKALIRYMQAGNNSGKKSSADPKTGKIPDPTQQPITNPNFNLNPTPNPMMMAAAMPQVITTATPVAPAIPGSTPLVKSGATTTPKAPAVPSGTTAGTAVTFLENVQPAALGPKSPVTFEMQLTPAAAPTPSAPETTNAPIVDPPNPLPSLPAMSNAPPKSVAPLPAPSQPLLPNQPAADSQQDSAEQEKSREETPEKIPAVAGNDTSQTSTFQGAFHAPLQSPSQPQPIHNAPAPVKPAESMAAPAAIPEVKDLTPAQAGSGQIRQIDVRIARPDSSPVELQVAQRSGQIQVVVRTPDAGLETALRQDLGTLVHSLERSGFQAETFVPVAAVSAPEGSRMNMQSDAQHSHPDFSGNDSSSGQNGGRGAGGDSRGNASRDQRQQREAWTWEEQS